MANKEKIDYLLIDIRELEKMVAGMRDAEVYPVSFFSQTFDLTHKILNDLHILEGAQIEVLRKQMEEHQQLIRSIPAPKAAPHPEPELPVPEIITESIIQEEKIAEETSIAVEVPVETPIEQLLAKPAPLITEKQPVFLSELLQKQNLSDFRKAFSLNDRFYFRKELFSGDDAKMNKVITDLNEIHSYDESIAYLNEKLNWNIDDPTVGDFIKLLEKRFL